MTTKKDPELTSSHRHTESTATYETTLKKTWKLGNQLLYISKREKSHVEIDRRGWDRVLSKPHHQQNDSQWIMRDLTTWSFSQAPKLLRPAMERWAPKTSGFENHQVLYPWDPKDCSELGNTSESISLRGSSYMSLVSQSLHVMPVWCPHSGHSLTAWCWWPGGACGRGTNGMTIRETDFGRLSLPGYCTDSSLKHSPSLSVKQAYLLVLKL